MILRHKKILINLQRCLGAAMIISGFTLLGLISYPNDLLPDSFPRFFETGTSSVLPARDSVPVFDPNLVMSDTTFRSGRDFPNVSSVQAYLTRVRSPLANYTENGKTAAEIIFQAARGQLLAPSKPGSTIRPNLNPAIILTKLETEQSLLSLRNYDVNADPERRIAKAMGYACYDFQACDEALRGFTNQVTTAAWQLEYNFMLASGGISASEPYQRGINILTLDERRVFLSNAATAAFYRYTPHVYWGNYNVWKIIVVNGWGVNQETWTQAQIDAVNIPIKNSINAKAVDYGLKYSDVADLMSRSFPLSTQSEEVLKLQKYLRQTGYYTRVPNGFYGAPTKYAQDSFREDNKIAIRSAASASNATVVDRSITENSSTSNPSSTCSDLLGRSYRSGQTGEDVKQLQQCLRDLGLFNYPTNTGKVGAVTRAALNAYVAGGRKSTPVTVRAKDVSQLEFWGQKCSTLRNSTFRFGSSGNRVRALQHCMVAAGIFEIRNTTGFYGFKTDSALIAWRRS